MGNFVPVFVVGMDGDAHADEDRAEKSKDVGLDKGDQKFHEIVQNNGDESGTFKDTGNQFITIWIGREKNPTQGQEDEHSKVPCKHVGKKTNSQGGWFSEKSEDFQNPQKTPNRCHAPGERNMNDIDQELGALRLETKEDGTDEDD